MIISDRFGFAFVHIPKCAGSTVREQMQRLDPELFELQGRRTHPELGKIDVMHLPLDILRDYFPDAFARLRATHSYALTRDPNDRFRSSVSEYVKTYHGKRLAEFDEAGIQGILDEIIGVLAARTPLLPLRYVHFTPQARYVRLDGEDIVSRRYAVEDIGVFFDDLGRRTGVRLDPGSRANQDFAFRFKGSEHWLWRANQALKEALPYATYQGVKRRVKPLLVRQKPALVETVFTSTMIRDFVREVYAADFALHEEDRRTAA